MTSNSIIIASYAVIATVLFAIILKHRNTILDLNLKLRQKDDFIEKLRDDVSFWRDKSLMNGCNDTVHAELIDKYEKIIDKFIDNRKDKTDQVFMFEGKLYTPVDFTLNRTHGELDTLDVAFTGMYIPHEEGEKEKSND